MYNKKNSTPSFVWRTLWVFFLMYMVSNTHFLKQLQFWHRSKVNAWNRMYAFSQYNFRWRTDTVLCLNCRSILSDDRVSWIRPCITCIVQITLIRYIAQDNATRRLYQGSFNLCYWCNFNEAQNKIISASKLSSCKLKVKHPSLHNVYSCWVCKFAGALYERGTLVLQSLSSAYKYLLLNIRGSS